MDNKDLILLTDELKDETLLGKILDIEKLGRELGVGGMSTFQRQEFVLNPVEFVQGTTERSRQAIFEASVRISNLRGGVYDFHKANAEIKLNTAKKIRWEKKLLDANDVADKMEAEAEIQLLEVEIQRKTAELEALKYKADFWITEVKDFYVSFLKNEEELKKRGVSVLDWNTHAEQVRYWTETTNAKINKQLSYALMGRSQQEGDSLAMQNHTDVMLQYAQNIFGILPDRQKEEIKQIATNMGIKIEEKPKELEGQKNG
jgi:hypothetical protein